MTYSLVELEGDVYTFLIETLCYPIRYDDFECQRLASSFMTENLPLLPYFTSLSYNINRCP